MSEKRQKWVTLGLAAAGVVGALIVWKLASRPKVTESPRSDQTQSRPKTPEVKSNKPSPVRETPKPSEPTNNTLVQKSTEEVAAKPSAGELPILKNSETKKQDPIANAESLGQLKKVQDAVKEREAQAARSREQQKIELQNLQEGEKKSRVATARKHDEEMQSIQEAEEQDRYVRHENAALVAKQVEHREKVSVIRESIEREEEEARVQQEEARQKHAAAIREVEQLRGTSSPRHDDASSPSANEVEVGGISPGPSKPAPASSGSGSVTKDENEVSSQPSATVFEKHQGSQSMNRSVPRDSFAEVSPRLSVGRQVSPSINFVSPQKLSVALSSPSALSVLGLEVPTNTVAVRSKFSGESNSPFVFDTAAGCVNPIAHFPVCQSRYTCTRPSSPNFTAEFVLMAEDTTLSQSAGQQQAKGSKPASPTTPSAAPSARLQTERYMSQSIEALFSMEEMDGKRLKVLHRERASNLVQSTFDFHADLTVEARPDVGVHTTMYVANFYKVHGSTAYTFQLMCPRGVQEEAVELFLTLVQEARIDPAVTSQSPLAGCIRYHHHCGAATVSSGTPSTIVIEMPLSYSPTTSVTEGNQYEAHFRSRNLSTAADFSLVQSHNADLESNVCVAVPGVDYLLQCADLQTQQNVKIFATEAGAEAHRPLAFYVSPVIAFPLPSFGTPFVVEHRFGDALLSLYAELGAATPDLEPTTGGPSFGEITIGFMFGSKDLLDDAFSSEVLQHSAGSAFGHNAGTQQFTELSQDCVVETQFISVSGHSRVLGEEMTITFFAIATMPDEWLVIKSIYPTALPPAREEDWLEYVNTLSEQLRLF